MTVDGVPAGATAGATAGAIPAGALGELATPVPTPKPAHATAAKTTTEKVTHFAFFDMLGIKTIPKRRITYCGIYVASPASAYIWRPPRTRPRGDFVGSIGEPVTTLPPRGLVTRVR